MVVQRKHWVILSVVFESWGNILDAWISSLADIRGKAFSYPHLELLFLVVIIILNFAILGLQYHLINQYFKAFIYNIF